ncbi:hypothetical protein MIR68_010624 [Amoeboaphelidium protococcarum]|nr:hypothetical protein MIR68_010624 [Amoeboaphelidium protococcarum]
MYKLTQEEDAVMRDWLKKNVDRGFIRKSQSPYGVPCFFVHCLIAISTATIQCRTSSHQADGRNGQKMSVLRRRGWVSKGFNTRSFQAKLTGHIVTEMHSVSFIIRAGNHREVIGEGQLQQFLNEENIAVGDTMLEEFDDGQENLVVDNRVPSPQ